MSRLDGECMTTIPTTLPTRGSGMNQRVRAPPRPELSFRGPAQLLRGAERSARPTEEVSAPPLGETFEIARGPPPERGGPQGPLDRLEDMP